MHLLEVVMQVLDDALSRRTILGIPSQLAQPDELQLDTIQSLNECSLGGHQHAAEKR